jgi:hypothetical protein
MFEGVDEEQRACGRGVCELGGKDLWANNNFLLAQNDSSPESLTEIEIISNSRTSFLSSYLSFIG